MFANEPAMAREFADATPKDAKLPEHVKKAYFQGVADALERFGLKTASEEIRLKIPTRQFHGWDAAFNKDVKGKRANDATADTLAKLLNDVPLPSTPDNQILAKDKLDRSTSWGTPANMAGGDTASRLSDMGQSTNFGGI
jgi:hypothetical protein